MWKVNEKSSLCHPAVCYCIWKCVEPKSKVSNYGYIMVQFFGLLLSKPMLPSTFCDFRKEGSIDPNGQLKKARVRQSKKCLSVAVFFIFNTVFCCRMETLFYVWKTYPKNERHLCLVKHCFTKLSQNVSLINTHILMH